MDIPLPRTNSPVPEEYFWYPPNNSHITATPQLLQESESWRPPSSLCSTPPDVEMVDTRPDRNNTNPSLNLQKDSIEKSMTDFIDAEVEKFQKRVEQARLILNTFCNLMDALDDDELRSSMEDATVGLRQKIRNILSGNSGNAQPNNNQPSQTRARIKQNPRPMVQPPSQLRRPTVNTEGHQKPTPAAAATPRVVMTATAPPAPSTRPIEGSWSVVARRSINRPKQASQPAKTTTPLPNPSRSPTRAHPLPATQPDERLFLRLKEDHPWRKTSPHFVKLSLAAKLRVANSAIQHVTVVNSGFAITADNEAARNLLLSEAYRLESEESNADPLMQDLKLEAASKWISVLAPNVPDYLHSFKSSTTTEPGTTTRLQQITIPVTRQMVIEEVTLKTGMAPISARALASSIDRPASDWVIHFQAGTPKLGERLFEESGRITEFHRRPKIAQCNRCWGHHPTKICSRAPRCIRCGSIEHQCGACKQEIPRCINCHGPHRADDPGCMTRPARLKGKVVQRTQDQLTVIRQRGQKDRTARVREAEAKQKAAEATADNNTQPATQCP
ncbi:hypothetical protein K3495_g11149 [Podosphaera aphanis]|nr:hypothetical protein K3495_g11149 [Podosphaera aphanis]